MFLKLPSSLRGIGCFVSNVSIEATSNSDVMMGAFVSHQAVTQFDTIGFARGQTRSRYQLGLRSPRTAFRTSVSASSMVLLALSV